jgi:hypothetical protein
MSDFLRPVSTAMTQNINPWQFMFAPHYTINMGRSRSPEIESEVIDKVGSYGRQLGRIGDALVVLLTHFKPDKPLTKEEEKAVGALRRMLEDIAEIKDSQMKRASM